MSRPSCLVLGEGDRLTLVIPVDGVRGVYTPNVPSVKQQLVFGRPRRSSKRFMFHNGKSIEYNEGTGEIDVNLDQHYGMSDSAFWRVPTLQIKI